MSQPCRFILTRSTGKGVHVVTVNDYLARRDSEWMGQIYQLLGMSVGCIVHDLDDHQRQTAYGCDVTYGTNNEFGFDYLRDNMKFRLEDMAQRPFSYAIVDEVDSILIDEARTPLIISGPTEDSSELYIRTDALIPKLADADFEKDEKQRTVALTESGVERMEELFRESGMLETGTLYDIHNVSLVHHANPALRAHKLFARDTEYIVKDDKIVIIDEFTGRMMEGRRYSEGLHQALEAKEHVTVQNENQTLASITFQNYFRMYPKLAGMTGTAMTESEEFSEIYRLDVIEVPTNEDVIRADADDEVYRSTREKFEAITTEVLACRQRQQPVLVGTVSIEKSEALSQTFKKQKIPHNVLNARFHDQEALIIAQAGVPGTVTIATNMAGRGTDIQLGGNLDMRLKADLAENADLEERETRAAAIRAEIEAAREVVRQAGGLYVIGSERHESRRIDNQLRGRSGRQGDPGASKFFVSLEDDLMRIFGSERMESVLSRLGLKEGEAIIHPWVNKALAKAQQKVEARNYDIRKQLLKYDDVMNDQRKVVYEQRKEIMSAGDVAAMVADMREEVSRGGGGFGHPRQRASRTMECRGASCRMPAPLWHRRAHRRLGQGRGHRFRRCPRAPHRRRGPQDGRKDRQLRPRTDAHGGEEPPAPASRSHLERPPAIARSSAPGDQPAGLCPARSAQRVQARGVRSIRGDARRAPRGSDLGVEPRRIADGAAAADARAAALYRGARRRSPKRRWRWPVRRGPRRRDARGRPAQCRAAAP